MNALPIILLEETELTCGPKSLDSLISAAPREELEVRCEKVEEEIRALVHRESGASQAVELVDLTFVLMDVGVLCLMPSLLGVFAFRPDIVKPNHIVTALAAVGAIQMGHIVTRSAAKLAWKPFLYKFFKYNSMHFNSKMFNELKYEKVEEAKKLWWREYNEEREELFLKRFLEKYPPSQWEEKKMEKVHRNNQIYGTNFSSWEEMRAEFYAKDEIPEFLKKNMNNIVSSIPKDAP